MHVESGGQVRAVSPKGAMGLMQIMPQTYAGRRCFPTAKVFVRTTSRCLSMRSRTVGRPTFALSIFRLWRHDRTGFSCVWPRGPSRNESYRALSYFVVHSRSSVRESTAAGRARPRIAR
jgi:hypothetical protein